MPDSQYVPTWTPGRAELDEFLTAPVCDEQNGMTLSVVSAMARLGIDPWSEAARLAALSRANAATALAGLIDRLFAGAAAAPDAASIASRLVKLLPEPGRAAARVGRPPASALEEWTEVNWPRVCALVALAVAIGYFVI